MISRNKFLIALHLSFVTFGLFMFAHPSLAASVLNPLGETDPRVIIGRVISGILAVVGSLALLMFVYGGLLWVISGGNEDKIKQGKSILAWASIGLVVIFMSYILVNVLVANLTNNFNSGGTTDSGSQTESDTDSGSR